MVLYVFNCKISVDTNLLMKNESKYKIFNLTQTLDVCRYVRREIHYSEYLLVNQYLNFSLASDDSQSKVEKDISGVISKFYFYLWTCDLCITTNMGRLMYLQHQLNCALVLNPLITLGINNYSQYLYN